MNKHCLNTISPYAFILIFMMGSNCGEALKPCKGEECNSEELRRCANICHDAYTACTRDKNAPFESCIHVSDGCEKSCYHPKGWLTPSETWGF